MAIWQSLAAVALVLLVAGEVAWGAVLVPDQTLQVDGHTRFYDAYLPNAGLPANAPVVVLLHGGASNRRSTVNGVVPATGWLDVTDGERLLLIVPNGTDGTSPATWNFDATNARWNDCRGDDPSDTGVNDVAFIDALLD